MTAQVRVPRWRRALPLVLLLAGIVAAAALTGGQPARDGPPLDPTSTGPVGTAGLVQTLRALGADVAVTGVVPDEPGPVVLVLADSLEPAQHDALTDWVQAGGTLVVTDPRSPLGPGPAEDPAGFLPADALRPDCDLAVLAAVEEVSAPGAIALSSPPGSAGCFPRAEGHWLVATPSGRGAVVALGGPEVWTNRRLGAADNAILAAALLAPEPGARVHLVRPARPGEGGQQLADLIDPRVLAGLIQAALAFLLFAVWRARRLGPPPSEPQPVTIPAAELVVAAGNLYQQAGARGRAAALLRDEVRAVLCRRLGLPPATGDEALMTAAHRVAGIDPDRLRRLLGDADPPDDRSLTTLARDAEDIRSRLTRTELQGANRV